MIVEKTAFIYDTVHRIGTEAHAFEYQRVEARLKQYIFAYNNRVFGEKLDIILTFTKDDFDELDKDKDLSS